MKKNILFLAFTILVVTLCNCSDSKRVHEELKKIAASTSEHCPIKISDDTQLDTVYAAPDRVLVYQYTLFLLDSVAFDKKQFGSDRAGFIQKTITESPDMAYLRSLKVTFRYEYKDQRGEELFSISVLPRDYE